MCCTHGRSCLLGALVALAVTLVEWQSLPARKEYGAHDVAVIQARIDRALHGTQHGLSDAILHLDRDTAPPAERPVPMFTNQSYQARMAMKAALPVPIARDHGAPLVEDAFCWARPPAAWMSVDVQLLAPRRLVRPHFIQYWMYQALSEAMAVGCWNNHHLYRLTGRNGYRLASARRRRPRQWQPEPDECTAIGLALNMTDDDDDDDDDKAGRWIVREMIFHWCVDRPECRPAAEHVLRAVESLEANDCALERRMQDWEVDLYG